MPFPCPACGQPIESMEGGLAHFLTAHKEAMPTAGDVASLKEVLHSALRFLEQVENALKPSG